MKRVFFSINPNNKEREVISQILEEKKSLFPSQTVRWVKEENIHMTLLFVGAVREEKMDNLLVANKKAVEAVKPFSIEFNQVCYTPEKGSPKIIWIKGGVSSSLLSLRDNLKTALADEGLKFVEEENLTTHITLGRVKSWEIKKMDTGEIPDVKEDLSFSLQVDSLYLMESVLRKGSPEYNILNSAFL